MGKNILVLSNDIHVTKLIHTNLAVRGYDVALGQARMQPLEIARKPALIIVDSYLLEPSEWGLLGWLKGIELTRDVPMIVITSGTITRENLAEFNIAAYVEKPFSINDLLAAVQKAT